MASAELPPIAVRFQVDTSGLDKAVSEAKRSGGKISKNLDDAGKKAGKLFAGGLAVATGAVSGLATASVRAFSDFESEFAKIEGLVGVGGEELEKLKESAKTLGPEFGKSGQEAAEALFFITSAGLEGSDATDVLEASLKASASGLGETSTVADLATSAMNAYGSEILSATDATDVLTAAVREGKLEPDELSGAMGQVLPVASSMGVSFDEVGAAFASMSRTGTGASEAATQLRGIMTSILKPTTQAEEALGEMGLSSSGLKQQIKDEGLLSVLDTLTTSMGDNEVGAEQVFGNVRALSGVMDLMGSNVEGTREIFDNMTDSSGVLDEAFGATSETAEFKFNQAMEKMKGVGLDIGGTLMPVLATLFTTLAPIIKDVGEQLLIAFEEALPSIEMLVDALPGLLEALLPIIPSMVEIVATMIDLATAVLPTLLPLLTMLTENAPLILGLVGAFAALVQIGKTVATVIGIINIIMSGGTIGIVIAVIAAIAALVAGIVYLATQTTFFQDTWEIMTTFVKDAWDGVVSFFTTAGEIIANGFQAAADTVQDIWNTATSFVAGLVESIGEKIRDFFNGAVEFIKGLGERLKSIGKTIFQAFVDGALEALFALPQLAADIIGKIPGLGGISDAISGGISNIKAGVSGALTGNRENTGTGGTTVVNNYQQSISASGLTVGQVQDSAVRRGTLMRPVGTRR